MERVNSAVCSVASRFPVDSGAQCRDLKARLQRMPLFRALLWGMFVAEVAVFFIAVAIRARSSCGFMGAGGRDALEQERCVSEYQALQRLGALVLAVTQAVLFLHYLVKIVGILAYQEHHMPRLLRWLLKTSRLIGERTDFWVAAASPDLFRETEELLRITNRLIACLLIPLSVIAVMPHLPTTAHDWNRELSIAAATTCGHHGSVCAGAVVVSEFFVRLNALLNLMATIPVHAAPALLWSSTVERAARQTDNRRVRRFFLVPWLCLPAQLSLAFQVVCASNLTNPGEAMILASFGVKIATCIYLLWLVWWSMMLHDMADLAWKTMKRLLHPRSPAPQGTGKVRDQMATCRSYQGGPYQPRPGSSSGTPPWRKSLDIPGRKSMDIPWRKSIDSRDPRTESTECLTNHCSNQSEQPKSTFSRSCSHESGGNYSTDQSAPSNSTPCRSGPSSQRLPLFFSTGIFMSLNMQNASDGSAAQRSVNGSSSESLGIESSAGHRLEILLLVQIGLWTDVFISPTAFKYALVIAIRAVALVLLVTAREIECSFSDLEEGSAGFGLVVCAKSLLQALEKQRDSDSFGCSLPLYKGTLHRMGETLAVSYRWQDEQVMLNSDFDINMREFQLRALADAIRQSRARYVWLDKLSVPQHKCILKNTLLARMMAVYAAAHTTLVIRTAEEDGSRYHERAWTFQEYCCCRRVHVVTERAVPEDGRWAISEDEEAEFADLRRMMQASISDVIPFWLRSSKEQIDRERAQAVLETHRHLSMQLTSTVEGDKVRALTPLLTYTPVENQKELVALVIQLSNASGQDLQDWKDALFDSHICNNGTRSTRMLHSSINQHNKRHTLRSSAQLPNNGDGIFDLPDPASPFQSPQISRTLRRATSEKGIMTARLLRCDGFRESDILRTAASAGPGAFVDLLSMSLGAANTIPEISDGSSDGSGGGDCEDFGSPPSPMAQHHHLQVPSMAFLQSAKKAMATPSRRRPSNVREVFGSPGHSANSSMSDVYRTGIELFDRGIDSPGGGGVGGRDLMTVSHHSSASTTYTASRLGSSSRPVPAAADASSPPRSRLEPLPGAIPGSAEASHRSRRRTPGTSSSGRSFWGSPLKPLPRLGKVELQEEDSNVRKCLRFGDEELGPGASSPSISGAPGSPSLFHRMMRTSNFRLRFDTPDDDERSSVRSPDDQSQDQSRRTIFLDDDEEAINAMEDCRDCGSEDLPRRQLDFDDESDEMPKNLSGVSIDV